MRNFAAKIGPDCSSKIIHLDAALLHNPPGGDRRVGVRAKSSRIFVRANADFSATPQRQLYDVPPAPFKCKFSSPAKSANFRDLGK
jgi:hypothetical protein